MYIHVVPHTLSPGLQLIGTEHWATRHQTTGCLGDVIRVEVEGVHGMEQSDVSRGCSCSQSKTDLGLLGTIQQSSGKGAYGPVVKNRDGTCVYTVHCTASRMPILGGIHVYK